MKKILLLIPVILLACSEKKVETGESYIDSSASIHSENEKILKEMHMTLKETEDLEDEVGSMYHSKETLLKENKQLKKEIKRMRDSIIEMKIRVGKKQTFLQRLFNIKIDSIQVATFDTVSLTTIEQ